MKAACIFKNQTMLQIMTVMLSYVFIVDVVQVQLVIKSSSQKIM